MVFHFVQGGGVVALLDEGFNEIEDLFLSFGKHRVEFRFTFDNSTLSGQSQGKDRMGAKHKKRLPHRLAEKALLYYRRTTEV